MLTCRRRHGFSLGADGECSNIAEPSDLQEKTSPASMVSAGAAAVIGFVAMLVIA